MLPTREEALKLIRDGLLFNPGPWGEHCLTAAHCAEKIASACGDMDVEKAYILGLRLAEKNGSLINLLICMSRYGKCMSFRKSIWWWSGMM